MKRIIFKMIDILWLPFLHILFHINHRTYMRLFVSYLIYKGVHIKGKPRYIGIHVKFDDFKLISIGDKTTISDECHLLTHDYSITNAMRAVGKTFPTDIAIVRGISIGKNCFVGKKSLLLPGTEIGDNCIIGAGSVVRGRIPSNSVVLGNPSSIISSVDSLAQKWEKYIDGGTVRKDKR